MESFKPSQVVLNAVPPLVGTMGHSECEHAAALIVRACQVRGDAWAPVGPRDIGEVLNADIDARTPPWPALGRNPFFRPDFHKLVACGFAKWIGEGEGEKDQPMELTPAGIEALRRWVVQPKS